LRRFPQVEFAKSSARDSVSTPPSIRGRNAFEVAFSQPRAFEVAPSALGVSIRAVRDLGSLTCD
jgi:hypothetical protein